MSHTRTKVVSLLGLLSIALSPTVWISARCLAADPFGLPSVTRAQVSASASELPSGLVLYRYAIDAQGDDGLPIYLISLDLASMSGLSRGIGAVIDLDEEFIDSTLGLGPGLPVYSPVAPPLWTRGVTAENEMMWSTTRDPIHSGESRAPFELVSAGLPGIQTLELESILVDFLPSVEEAAEMDLGPHEMRQLVDAAAYRVTSIGPVAPPRNFTPMEFLAEIEALELRARDLGWIRPASGIPELTTLLLRLRSDLERDEISAARQSSREAIELVQSLACALEDCPSARSPISSEGRALVALNLGYLRRHLSEQVPPSSDAGPGDR